MSSALRSWMAVGVVAFMANAALRPAIARASDDQPAATVTPPAGGGVPPAQPAPAAPPAPYPGYPPPGYAPYPGYPPPGYPPPGYAPPGYAPPGYAPYAGYPPLKLTKVHRKRRGLVTGGLITFGVSWGVAATISFVLASGSCSGNCSEARNYLWIPIAGPTLVAARDSGNNDGAPVLFVWSAAQAAGAIMLIIGMAGHDVMEYQVARGGPTLRLAPLFARDASGMALTARW